MDIMKVLQVVLLVLVSMLLDHEVNAKPSGIKCLAELGECGMPGWIWKWGYPNGQLEGMDTPLDNYSSVDFI